MLIKMLMRLRGTNPSASALAAQRRLSKFEQAKIALEWLEGVTSFDAIKAASIQMQCTDANIVEFLERLARYTHAMHLKENITPSMCFGELHNITLDNFYTTSDGMYVSQKALMLLCEQARALFTAIDASKERDDGNAVYAERLLSKTFSTITSLQEATKLAA